MTAQKEEILLEVENLKKQIGSADCPPDLKERVLESCQGLERMAGQGIYPQHFEQVRHYVDWIVNLPWQKRSDDILDLNRAKKILDQNHFGLEPIKERILEYLAVLKLKKEESSSAQTSTSAEASVDRSEGEEGIMKFMRAPMLFFVGLVGTGKTTIAYSIAEAMGRKFERVPFGGIGDPLYLRGQARAQPGAEPGQIIKSLRRAGTRNPVILLDEIDRVVEESRATIMGVLVELLDPEQNMAFRDHFLDASFNLSEVLFIATANNTNNIATAVLDRLEPIRMPSYTDEEKITIGKDYVLPRMMKESGLPEGSLKIEEAVWPKIVRPLGYDAGVRTLQRTINGICRKVAKMVVEGKGKQFVLTEANIKDFLPTG
jgi:ATP-dependent Lon protease